MDDRGDGNLYRRYTVVQTGLVLGQVEAVPEEELRLEEVLDQVGELKHLRPSFDGFDEEDSLITGLLVLKMIVST